MLTGRYIKIIIVLFMTACFVGGCTGSTLKVKPISTSENPTEQVKQLDKEISQARSNKLDVLAPTWFGKAETSLSDAKKGLEAGDELSLIMQKVADGRAQLRRAEEISQLAETVLKDPIKARERARAAGAAKLESYGKAEKQFVELSKAIEDNNLKYARKNSPKVVNAFDELELLAIKDEALGEARKLMHQAEADGAKKITPKTLIIAQKKLSDTDAYISEHRYEKEKINALSNETLFQARRLMQVMDESKKIRTMEPEQIILWFERMLYKTSRKLSEQDLRDKDFETQVDNILTSIGALQGDRQSIIAKSKSQQKKMKDMENEIASLYKIIDEKEEKIKKMEADIIRLQSGKK